MFPALSNIMRGVTENRGGTMLLIFDLDGTLFQAKTVCLRADLRLLSEMNVSAPDENTLLKNAGQGLDPFLRSILPDGADIDAARLRYVELVREEIFERGELFPGVLDALMRLRSDGHMLVICSNSPVEYISTVLEHTGIAGLFAQYHSAEGYPSKADLIRELLVEMIIPGGAAIVIGDTHGDVEAAHKNGLPAIAVTYGYGNVALLSAAEYIVDSPEEIINTVNILPHRH